MKEQELVKMCQKNDLEAFGKLFDMYGNLTKRTVFLIVGDMNLTDDIMQEAFINCFKNIKKLKKPEKFKSWFYKILVRTSWKIIKKERKNAHLEIDEEKLFKSKDDVLYNLESKEIRETIINSIRELKFNLRITVVLYYFNELSIKEIATTLNCMEGTVKSRLFTARKILKKKLEKYDFEFERFNGKECLDNVQ